MLKKLGRLTSALIETQEVQLTRIKSRILLVLLGLEKLRTLSIQISLLHVQLLFKEVEITPLIKKTLKKVNISLQVRVMKIIENKFSDFLS